MADKATTGKSAQPETVEYSAPQSFWQQTHKATSALVGAFSESMAVMEDLALAAGVNSNSLHRTQCIEVLGKEQVKIRDAEMRYPDLDISSIELPPRRW